MPTDTVVRPATLAFEELTHAVRALGEELAVFRRRALEAERRLRELAPPGERAAASAADPSALGARVAELEAENAELRARVSDAAERTRAMADRMRFVRQQQEADGER